MNRIKTLLILTGAATLAACATATPYQPLKDGRGYSEQKIESNRYKVFFAGNSQTARQTVENYLLYRAAEVTLNNGYDYFVFADRDTEAETRYSQSFNGGIGGFGGFGFRNSFGLGVGVGSSNPITEYEAQADILVFKGKKPEAAVSAYDARDIKANLETLIARPPLKSS